MMAGDDRIYELLPAIHRMRDAEQGYPLRAVLRVVAGQMRDLEANIAQLYDDWFIETCQEWAIPYLADLVGVTLGPPPVQARDDPADPFVAAMRREVANALGERRAKGTLSVLERVAADTTGWPARAVEYGPLIAVTQSARHPEPSRGRLLDTRDEERLEAIGTAFSTLPTVVDTRSASASQQTAIHSLPGVAVAVWRLASDDTARAPALCVNDDNHYSFDPLGRDLQLCVRPTPRAPGTRPAGDLDVPAPITRLKLAHHLEDYYGPDRSVCVYRRSGPVGRREIVAADLSDWWYRPRPGQVAIDPALGRIAFPEGHAPEDGVWVRYSRLTVGQIGGGHYPRMLAPFPATPGPGSPGGDAQPRPSVAVYRVSAAGGELTGVSEALAAWEADRAAGRAGGHAIVEITDDEIYEEQLRIDVERGQRLEIRAADGCRPVLQPVGRQPNRPQSLVISGPDGAHRGTPRQRSRRSKEPPGKAETTEHPVAGDLPCVAIDGVWVTGHAVELTGELGEVTVRHCTLVPGEDGDPDTDDRDLPPGLLVRTAPRRIVVDHSVIARIAVDVHETGSDPVPVTVTDSIIDALGLSRDAIDAPGGHPAYVAANLERATLLGGASVHEVSLVADTIVTGPLRVYRRQAGVVRFSYVPPGSATPRRTRCQPDGVLQAAGDAADRALAAAHVVPRFDDVHANAPAYGRLADGTAAEIVTGASDEGEMGAFHDLWLGRRFRSLQARIAEFTPVGADIGVLFAS